MKIHSNSFKIELNKNSLGGFCKRIITFEFDFKNNITIIIKKSRKKMKG